MSMEKLTWDELADIYHKITGTTAKVRPMAVIFEWAENHKELFMLNEDETISYIGEKLNDTNSRNYYPL